MVESVYSNDNAEANRACRAQTSFKMPKNIRQVGKSNVTKKIYVEDYVMTFARYLAGDDYSSCRIAVLVGQYVKLESGNCLFISGAVEVKNIDAANEIVFTNDHWTQIYEDIKKYFPEYEIVGWFIGGPGYLLEDKEKILKTHLDNFAGQDKTLLTYDNIEKEEAFYLYENGSLCRQEGYYIYYEKNEEMQNYMIDHKQKPSEEAQYDDRVSREIRAVIQNKKGSADEVKSINRLVYAAGTLLAVIILVVGAAILNNYDQMKNMQNTLNALSQNLKEVESVFRTKENQQENTDQNSKKTNEAATDKEGSLNVEVVPGGIKPLEENNEKKEDEKSNDNVADSSANSQKAQKSEQAKNTETADANSEVVISGGVKYYTVKAGDSLAGISYKLYNSANYISVIKELNNIEDENLIYIGQKLIVP
ncbi:LysM domain-containing protein [Herbinix hemicellulosilytica]|uniref:Putative membrane protein n=1 Tax=Herbinix hemicellulosilytica TaxID=1564487 RepID=A0A0H5SYF8_HERHM|nr:LysM domain-containing protein [Herbinix hemicellulosilytica]RBP56405.1 LysM domain-containing protein [Herbinix hemicellulosilytica]CRZ35428.1 putative membrane protein [Herbinix hemicellulosilytica]